MFFPASSQPGISIYSILNCFLSLSLQFLSRLFSSGAASLLFTKFCLIYLFKNQFDCHRLLLLKKSISSPELPPSGQSSKVDFFVFSFHLKQYSLQRKVATILKARIPKAFLRTNIRYLWIVPPVKIKNQE